jgi:hypothetical protein
MHSEHSERGKSFHDTTVAVGWRKFKFKHFNAEIRMAIRAPIHVLPKCNHGLLEKKLGHS